MSQETPTEREEIEMLLPWYVTGKLEARDKTRVDAALARDAGLRHQLDLIREEQSVDIAANERISAPRTLTVESGMSAVAAKTSLGVRRSSAGLLERVKEFFVMPTPRAVRFATAAALAVVLLQAAAIGNLIQQRGGYTTASGPAEAGSTVIVKFVDGANAQAIANTLAQHNATIVDGPKPGGTFVVRIGPKSLSKTEQDAQIAALRKASGVIALVMP